MHTIRLKDDYIKLGQALKAAGVVESGVDAKFAVQDGLVKVNGQTETQRGKKHIYNVKTYSRNLSALKSSRKIAEYSRHNGNQYNINESFFAVQKLIGYLVSYVSRKQF